MTKHNDKSDLNFLPAGITGDCIRRIYSLESALQAGLCERLGQSGLSPSQMKLLARVARSGEQGCRVSDIARTQLSGTKQNVSSMLKKLHKNGYLTVGGDTNDGRSRRYSLTPEGKQAIHQFLPLHRDYMQTVFSALNQSEMKLLLDFLTTLESSITNTR